MITNSPAETDAVESLTTTARPLLIAGVPMPGAEVSSVEFPYDGREIGRVWLADAPLLEQAIAAADDARESMAALPPHERAEILGRSAELVRGRGEELATQMTLETGNAIWETRLEVNRCVEVLRAAGRGSTSSDRGDGAHRRLAERRRAHRLDTAVPSWNRARNYTVQRPSSCSSRTSSRPLLLPDVPASCGPPRKRRSQRCRSARSSLRPVHQLGRSALCPARAHSRNRSWTTRA